MKCWYSQIVKSRKVITEKITLKNSFLVHDFQVSLIKIQLRYTESWKNHDGEKIREVKEEEYKIEIVLC